MNIPIISAIDLVTMRIGENADNDRYPARRRAHVKPVALSLL
jgi:hypothetical protein